MTKRATIDVDGVPVSYLTAGERGPLVLLLHGTFWSRVWQPVLDGIAAAGLRPVAVDFPGFGHSGGQLSVTTASIPALAAWLVRFLGAMNAKGSLMVAGHDIGGGVAQHLLVRGPIEVTRLALVNAVMYDSWPAPGVARFQDPAVAAATSTEDLLAARRQSVIKAIARSWLALAGAADNRYTLELLTGLRASTTPKLLVWGEDDTFQAVDYAERFAAEIPATRLIRIHRAGHIPMENDHAAVAWALGNFFSAH